MEFDLYTFHKSDSEEIFTKPLSKEMFNLYSIFSLSNNFKDSSSYFKIF